MAARASPPSTPCGTAARCSPCPGSRRNPSAEGCNELIADGAHPLLRSDDVLIGLGLTPGVRRGSNPAARERPAPTGDAARVLQAFSGEPATPDQLAHRSGIGVGAVAMALCELARDGWARSEQGPLVACLRGNSGIPVPGFKAAERDADTPLVTFERCPYDATLISAEAFSGGSLMLTCECCGAAWEAHNSLIRRVIEPSWDEVQAAQAEQREHAATTAESPKL